MPIYEYACKSCNHTLDALQKMSDDPLQDCPACGKSALKRLISAPRFRLKGKGWYETDFKTDNQRNLAKSDSEKAKGDSEKSKTENKTESKTEKKPDKMETTKTESKKKSTSKKDSA
jgi:putative FmdB family regulatory protein